MLNTRNIKTILCIENPLQEYSNDDLYAAQLQFLSGPAFSIDRLVDAFQVDPALVADTLGLLHANPELAGLSVFPLHIFTQFIHQGDFDRIPLVERLCHSLAFFTDTLYAVAFRTTETPVAYFANLAIVLGFVDAPRHLQSRPLWGLERHRIGFLTDLDKQALLNLKLYNIPLVAPLPFFLESGFSLVSGFDPADAFTPGTVTGTRSAIEQLYQCILPLLGNPNIKNNFCDLIVNAYGQDRSKLEFDRKQNCTDSFCYTLLVLLLKTASGIFNVSFVDKINLKKFPTFCFFYISRLMEISLYRLVGDVKERYNVKNSMALIWCEEDLIQRYFNFVYALVARRGAEVMRPVTDRCSGCSFDTCTEVLDFTLENKKATVVGEILHDEAFINTILALQGVLPCRKVSHDAMVLIGCLLGYKNTHKSDCLRVIKEANLPVTAPITSRIIKHYCMKTDEHIYQDRFEIHDILQNCVMDPDKDTLRMISLALGSLEEQLSLIFESIVKINEMREKEAWLAAAGEDTALSEDEEQIELYPDSVLRTLAAMTAEQRMDFIRRRTDPNRTEAVNREVEAQLEAVGSEFRTRQYKKMRVNSFRIERQEKVLMSSSVYLENLLKFLQNFTKVNKKLFLNKSVFFRLFLIANSALESLVGEKSMKLRIQKKEEYKLHPKELLRLVLLIIVNVLSVNGVNVKLVHSSGLDAGLVGRALQVAKDKYLMMEEHVLLLEEICRNIPETREEEDEDVPDEFLDPLTFMLMKDPVQMQTSRITIDRSTFNQIMLNDQIDPFSRLPLDESKIVEDRELKEKIEQYRMKGA